ncbi:hypothetical protein MMC18_006920 [Xylographa bjoerkii]|nr:hypothetical protein [Xylographa bjoerkii]
MPPRKSNVSAVSAPADEGTSTQAGKEKDGINIEDLSMPRTMVQRLAKGVLPPNTQLQKDSITAFSKGATVFVNFLTHSAHAHTLKSQRKTIAPADVLLGLRDTEFDFMIPRLEAELNKYNEVQTAKRNEYRKKVREGTMGVGRRKSGAGDPAAGVSEDVAANGEKEGERAAKRSKLDEEGNAAMAGAGDDDETEDEDVAEAEEGGEAEGEGDNEEDEDVSEGEDDEAEADVLLRDDDDDSDRGAGAAPDDDSALDDESD